MFYYITDLDSNTAVLLYGSYTSSGYVKYGANVNNGPTIARSYLPTTSDWSNVSLSNPVRNISNIVNFSYSGYAARLPSKSEIELCVNNNIVFSPGASGTDYRVFWLEDIYIKIMHTTCIIKHTKLILYAIKIFPPEQLRLNQL